MEDVEVDRVRALLEARMLGKSSIVATIGRFVVLDRLGTGGMGVVYAAYDPKLDRKVALKLLLDVDRPAIQQRLLREAQAMARLAHPNVVTVFEIGEHDGRAFVAMELVHGQTLRAWVDTAPRTQREILEVYLEAGRGLAAVHAADLVHRDFKPDNVMIGTDGRVRVMDFGLVRAELVVSEDADDGSSGVLDLPLTRHDARLGTPAYMAPELILGEATDARTDQFAFCVSLWEALAGARPFAGTTSKEVFAAVLAQDLQRPPRGRLPAWIEPSLVRGLARDPAARHATMDQLLQILGDDPTRKRRRRIALASAPIVLALGIGTRELRERMRIEACDDLRRAPAWDDSRATRVRDGLVATGVSYATDTATRAEPALANYAQTLADARASVCHAHEVSEDLGDATAHAARACFDDAASALEELVALLSAADAIDVEHAIASITALPPIETCRDPYELERRRATRETPEILEARRELGRARVHWSSGRYREALLLAERGRDAAVALGDDQLRATALWLVGSNHAQLGNHAEALRNLELAFDLGIVSDEPAAAFRSARLLAFRTGFVAARPAHAAGWLAAARSVLAMRARDEPIWRAELRMTEGMVALRELDPARAEASMREALETARGVYGPDHRMVALLWNDLGDAQYAGGQLEQALESHRQAMATLERVVGPDHPDVAFAATGLGRVEGSLGHLETSLRHHEHALRLRKAALGSKHPSVAMTRYDIGNEYLRHGDTEAARNHLLAAVEIWRAANGDDSPDAAQALFGLAHIEYAAHQLPLALDYAKQAIAVNERRGDVDADLVVRCYGVLGLVAEAMQDRKTAKDALERAVSLAERALGSEHVRLIELLNNLGNTEHALGEDESASRHYARSLELLEVHGDLAWIDRSYPLIGLGLTADALGEHDVAARHFERALELRKERLGAEHPMVATSLGYLGSHYEATKQYARSRDYFTQAVALLDEVREQDASSLQLLLDWAHMEMSDGRSGAAVELAKRAMKLAEVGRTAGWLDTAMDGNIHYTLAQALGKRDRRARALASRALALHETRGTAGESSSAAVRAWLDGE